MKYKKYIVLSTVGGYEIRLDEVEYHRDLLSEDELRHKRSNIDGGGMYSILEDEKKIVFMTARQILAVRRTSKKPCSLMALRS